MSIDLGLIYNDDYLDLTDGEPYLDLLWTELSYYEDGEEIKIPEFGITDLSTLKDLRYFHKHYTAHNAAIYRWMDHMIESMEHIWDTYKVDTSFMKEQAEDRWNNDDDLQDEHETFDDYWSSYEDSSQYHEDLAEQQQFWWDDFREDNRDAFEILDKEMSDGYTDSWNNINKHSLRKALDEAFDDESYGIEAKVKEFLENRKTNEEIFDNIFEEM